MSSRDTTTHRPRRTLPQRLTGLAISLVGTGVGMHLASRSRVDVGPAVVDAKVTPSADPGTTVNVPPFGQVRLATHKGVLRLDATVVGIDEDAARELLTDRSLALTLPQLRPALVRVAIRSAASGVVGAGVLSALTQRRLGATVSAALTSAGVIAVAGAVAAKTVNQESWRTPQLSGLLAQAPKIIGDVENIPVQFDRCRKQLSEIAASVTGVFRGLSALPDGPPGDAIRIVHLSDIHNNPLAYAIARSLVEQYKADAVIDTGDIGDWGTPHEAKTFEEIGTIGVPYIFIKGNHDSIKTLAALEKFDNVRILNDGAITEIAGLKIAGDADPRFTPDKSTGGDSASKDQLAAVGKKLAETLKGSGADIALIHDPVVAVQLAGVVPLVLAGHTHKRGEHRREGTLFLTQGSSGGAGLRGVRQDTPDSLTASVLHIDRDRHTLVSLDEFTFGGLGLTQVALVRRNAKEIGQHTSGTAPADGEAASGQSPSVAGQI